MVKGCYLSSAVCYNFKDLNFDMEQELTCPACTKYFSNPIILPCSHSICMACALRLQAPMSHCDDSRSSVDFPDMDKMSLYSEADSGVSMGTGSSRPNSYLAASSANLLANNDIYCLSITCPYKTCKHTSYLTEEGVASLPKNRVLETIVDKEQANKNFTVPCQVCQQRGQQEQKALAVCMCEQCEVFYCEKCKEDRHPLRGPLAQHNLVTLLEGKAILRQRNKDKESKCKEHTDETLSMYCLICKESVCYLCLQEGNRHLSHDVQAITGISKSHKVSTTHSMRFFMYYSWFIVTDFLG